MLADLIIDADVDRDEPCLGERMRIVVKRKSLLTQGQGIASRIEFGGDQRITRLPNP